MIDIARDIGCVGVELRNDVSYPLFDGDSAQNKGVQVQKSGLRILALAEVSSFNDWTDERAAATAALIELAVGCGAEAIALIPRNDGKRLDKLDRLNDLKLALDALKPMLKQSGIFGFIEPLGFETSNLRLKSEAVAAINAVDGRETFRLVHDTFHHTLAGECDLFPDHTGIVHVSGVANAELSFDRMQDQDRFLVDANDRLDNITQLKQLRLQGYSGPVSFEAFAPEIHSITDPTAMLLRSIQFIDEHLRATAA
ncbi:TIM barrel protein [Shimia sp.]|uniref:TIM barrel protein n=1 Tax=Shimia sp. TaxID=1954381 RepID=UPI0032994764